MFVTYSLQKRYTVVVTIWKSNCGHLRVQVPYAPLLKKAKLGKALILNRIRAFLFVWGEAEMGWLLPLAGKRKRLFRKEETCLTFLTSDRIFLFPIPITIHFLLLTKTISSRCFTTPGRHYNIFTRTLSLKHYQY